MTKSDVKEKFSGEGYPIQVIGRHMTVTEAMKAYAVDKLSKMERFGTHILDAIITMDIQKLTHKVDFIVDLNNIKVKVSGTADNMYAAIDMAIDHLRAKLRRYTRRLHEHHAKGAKEIAMQVSVVPRVSVEEINDQIEEETLKQREKLLQPAQVVAKETRPLKTLNHEEAIMHLELSEESFVIYRGEEDRKLKVIHKRDDGNYGIIELE